MPERPTIDATLLPPHAFDSRAPVWWGNTLMLVIETITLALLIVSYFYLWQNFTEWPPPRINEYPPLERPAPDLPIATVNVILMVVSIIPMLIADRRARKEDAKSVNIAITIVGLIALANIGLRFLEFPTLHFRWDDNAYASIVWGITGMHLVYLLTAGVELLVNVVWCFIHEFDEKLAMDVLLTAVFWYWTVGAGVVVYAVVYIAPRFMG